MSAPPDTTAVQARLERLIAERRGELVRCAWRRVNDHALAEDAVQEACAYAYANLHRVTPETDLRPWLLWLAKCSALRLYRDSRAARIIHPPREWMRDREFVEFVAPQSDAEAIAKLVAINQRMVAMPAWERDLWFAQQVVGFTFGEVVRIRSLGKREQKAAKRATHRADAAMREAA